jgi:peroxiredoxin
MQTVKIGQRPPTFRLPAGHGGEVSLDDYRGRNVIVWFTKGMGCAFCRTQMSQLARGYPRPTPRSSR